MDAVRSVIQPVTHNLPGPIRDLGVGIIGQTCYQALVLDVDETNVDCIKLGVSKGLGIAIIAASSVVKVPQILKLVNSRSAAGVSFLSYLLETCSYLITLAYNVRNGFPFSTYGETSLILVQNIVVTLLVLHYSGRANMVAVLATALAASAVALFSPAVTDMVALSYLQAAAGVMGVASKLPQIVAIWQEGGTGQLSAFAVSCCSPPLSSPPLPSARNRPRRWLTRSLRPNGKQVFNYLMGSLSRIFTTLQEVGDKLILFGFVSGFALNLVLAAQMVYYWGPPPPAVPQAKKTPAKKE